MNRDYCIDLDDQTLFVPWAFMLTLGACWAVFLPPHANRKLLLNVVRWSQVAAIALPVSAIITAKIVGLSAFDLAVGSWLAVILLYSVVVVCLIAGWRRLPFLDAIRYIYPAGDRCTVALLQQLFFALLTLSLFIAFRLTTAFAIAFCVFLLVNSAMVATALFHRSRTPK